MYRETVADTKARIAALSDSEPRESYGSNGALRFTAYYGLVGTAANLKTHNVSVYVWETGGVDIHSGCGTTSRWGATAHNQLVAKGDAEVTCQRCSKRSN